MEKPLNKKKTPGGRKFLIIVSVMWSAGPLRFIVRDEELVQGVVETALKLHARNGRLPVLGSDSRKFSLVCSNAGIASAINLALNPRATIGSVGVRRFILCKKPEALIGDEPRSSIKWTGKWKSLINKAFHFKIT